MTVTSWDGWNEVTAQSRETAFSVNGFKSCMELTRFLLIDVFMFKLSLFILLFHDTLPLALGFPSLRPQILTSPTNFPYIITRV